MTKYDHTSKKAIKTVSIALRPRATQEFSVLLVNLCNWLKKRDIAIQIYEEESESIRKVFKNLPKGLTFVDEKRFYVLSDLIISLGGDGTLIGAARSSYKNSPPIFGVNAGKLGFITEFSKGELFDGLSDVVNKRYTTEKINLFKVQVSCARPFFKKKSVFFNDAVINKLGISRMLSLSVEVDKEPVYNLFGDGLIVSSPLGSTAYSLAAGGPILNPRVKAMALTPICPHGLTHRPLVISDRSEVGIKVPRGPGYLTLTLDGQEAINLEPKFNIVISKLAGRYVRIIKNPAKTYFQTLQLKFKHGRKNI